MPPDSPIVAYVSGHGYGHATRTAEVLRVLRGLVPTVRMTVVSSAPEGLFRDAVPGPLDFRHRELDAGLAQRSALVIDEDQTLARLTTLAAARPSLIKDEVASLREVGARAVLADVPPVAFEISAAAGVAGVGLANFSWDWIYAHLARGCPSFASFAKSAADAYRKADLLLELPFAGDLSSFRTRVPIPLVARRPRIARHETRQRLGLDPRPAVLVSFGGLGLPGFDGRTLGDLDGYQFLMGEECPSAVAGNLVCFDRARLRRLGLGYEDVVGAADVVVTKPGYGIVSDALGAGTRIVYTDRGDFPEYPILVGQMERLTACVYVTNETVAAGRLGPALDDVMSRPLPPPPRLDGALVAARRLVELLG